VCVCVCVCVSVRASVRGVILRTKTQGPKDRTKKRKKVRITFVKMNLRSGKE